MLRLDEARKALIQEVARLRGISVTEYVCRVAVPQARKEVLAANEGVISLTPVEQLAFWKARNEPCIRTDAQKQLAVVMRGEVPR